MFGGRKIVPIDQIDPGPQLYPTDELFISLYQQHLLGTLAVEEAVIAIEGIDPHSDFRPIVHTDFLAEVEAAINRGEAPAITVYPRNDRFVMCDDYNVYFSYQDLKMQDIPYVVLGLLTGPHVRHCRPAVKLI